MVNSRAIGAKNEREYEKILQDSGYITQRVKGSTIYNKNVDFFGEFDMMALGHGEVLFTQVKTNRTAGAPKSIKKWIEENKQYLAKNVKFEVAVRYNNKPADERWRIIPITL